MKRTSGKPDLDDAAKKESTRRGSMDVLDQAGYQRFSGTPVGYLFDIPAISAEATRLVDRVSREKPDRTWYQSSFSLDDNGITLTVSFPRK
jgi:hypothetical protein